MSVAVKVKAPPSFVITYGGGHPLFPRPGRLLVWGNVNGIHLRVGKNTAVIPWSKIKSLTKVTWTELRVDSNGVEVALLFGDGANGYALLSQLIAGDARNAPETEPRAAGMEWQRILLYSVAGTVGAIFLAILYGIMSS
jgi:hypothetical protein